MWITQSKVHMYDTDIAGRIFFARQFYFIHEAIEEIFEKFDLPFDHLFSKSDYIFVIVHAEGDYYKPLNVGDRLDIHTRVEKVGTTSITFSFSIYRKDELVGSAKVTQVCLNSKTLTKMALPKEFLRYILGSAPDSDLTPGG